MNDSTAARTDESCWQEIINAHNTRLRARLGYATWADYLAGEWELSALSPSQLQAISRALRVVGVPGSEVHAMLAVPTQKACIGAEARTVSTQVYLIGSEEFRPVKIGMGNAKKRLCEFQVGNPFPLEILWTTPGGVRLEQALHARFQPYRDSGEWFEFPEGEDPVRLVSDAAADIVPGLGTYL